MACTEDDRNDEKRCWPWNRVPCVEHEHAAKTLCSGIQKRESVREIEGERTKERE